MSLQGTLGVTGSIGVWSHPRSMPNGVRVQMVALRCSEECLHEDLCLVVDLA